MPREKTTFIETVSDPKTGAATDIRLDKKTGYFVAEVGTAVVSGPSLADVRASTLQELAAQSTLDWQPVIVLEVTGGGRDRLRSNRDLVHRTELGVSFYRCEIATKQTTAAERRRGYDGRVTRPFLNADGLTDEDLENLSKAPKREQARYAAERARIHKNTRDARKDVVGFHADDDATVLPYTPERWATLQALSTRLEDIHIQLAALLDANTAAATLDAVLPAAFLTAPTPPEPTP